MSERVTASKDKGNDRWWLLRRQGVVNALWLGVRINRRCLEAHAWIAYDGVVLNDTPDVSRRFTPLACVTLGTISRREAAAVSTTPQPCPRRWVH